MAVILTFFNTRDLYSTVGVPRTQGRNEVRWRPGQEASLAPPCSNLSSFARKFTDKSTCDIFGTFRRPHSH